MNKFENLNKIEYYITYKDSNGKIKDETIFVETQEELLIELEVINNLQSFSRIYNNY